MIVNRNIYLQKLIQRRHNGMIKIITGIRRCGKSFLLFELYARWLEEQGIRPDHIIKIDLESRRSKTLRDPDRLLAYIDSHLTDSDMFYIMIDEIQHVAEFEDVLNSYLKIPNADVYVTGSNARFLSKDVITTFRGRGDEIKVYPLCFREFQSVYPDTSSKTLDAYMTYGGLPQIVSMASEEQKSEYLKALFTQTYLKDIKERYHIQHDAILNELLDIVSSSVGSLTNATKLENTFSSIKKERVSRTTISSYLDYICDSFLMEKATRYDIKGKKYIDTPYKYYFADLGLRNARLNFRQQEMTHLMENMIYNELRVRGFNVDVGVVPIVSRTADGKQTRKQLEVDFVCNQGSKRYYIQAAYRLASDEKIQQEMASLRHIDDSFKKIIVTGGDSLVHRNEHGITTMGIYDFLLRDDALEL